MGLGTRIKLTDIIQIAAAQLGFLSQNKDPGYESSELMTDKTLSSDWDSVFLFMWNNIPRCPV